MKPAGLVLLLPAGLIGGFAADESPAARLVSEQMSEHIRAGLPRFDATAKAAEPAPAATADPALAPGPDVLVLPKMTIKEQRLPADAADHLMSRKDFNRKMENLYLDEIAKDGELNYLLNSFTIPILSPSKAERGKALYIQRELQRLSGIPRDPDEQKVLRQEIERGTREAGPMTMGK